MFCLVVLTGYGVANNFYIVILCYCAQRVNAYHVVTGRLTINLVVSNIHMVNVVFPEGVCLGGSGNNGDCLVIRDHTTFVSIN